MSLDTKLFFKLNNFAHKSKRGDFLIMFFGSYIAYPLAVAFPLYLFLVQTPMREGIILSVSALIAGLIARLIFGSSIRFFHPVPRPPVTHALKPLINLKSPSFPSGHALFFFALSTFVLFFYPLLGVIFILITIGIATARVMAGVHYPSDMLAGCLIGIVSAYLSFLYVLPFLISTF
ncbi:MAG: phosphatase PAP2 family protein [Candidatus Paceibacterota bacterium]